MEKELRVKSVTQTPKTRKICCDQPESMSATQKNPPNFNITK